MSGKRDGQLLSLSEDRLLVKYRATIERSAQTLLGVAPQHVDIEDLVQSASLALLKAFRRLQRSDCGTAVDHYLRTRIWGALLDELRRTGPVPRRTLTRIGRAAKSGRALPTSNERARNAIGAARSQAGASTLVTRSAESQRTSSDQTDLTEARQLWALVEKALDRLPPTERSVLQLYYLHDATMHEVGKILGVSEGRVSQLHHAALMHLKTRMRRFAA